MTKLSTVISIIEKDNITDENLLLKQIQRGDSNILEAIYQARCNTRDEIIRFLKEVTEL